MYLIRVSVIVLIVSHYQHVNSNHFISLSGTTLGEKYKNGVRIFFGGGGKYIIKQFNKDSFLFKSEANNMTKYWRKLLKCTQNYRKIGMWNVVN